jgi:hypothetical protein
MKQSSPADHRASHGSVENHDRNPAALHAVVLLIAEYRYGAVVLLHRKLTGIANLGGIYCLLAWNVTADTFDSDCWLRALICYPISPAGHLGIT